MALFSLSATFSLAQNLHRDKKQYDKFSNYKKFTATQPNQ
jgi:hypothetical protein